MRFWVKKVVIEGSPANKWEKKKNFNNLIGFSSNPSKCNHFSRCHHPIWFSSLLNLVLVPLSADDLLKCSQSVMLLIDVRVLLSSTRIVQTKAIALMKAFIYLRANTIILNKYAYVRQIAVADDKKEKALHRHYNHTVEWLPNPHKLMKFVHRAQPFQRVLIHRVINLMRDKCEMCAAQKKPNESAPAVSHCVD